MAQMRHKQNRACNALSFSLNGRKCKQTRCEEGGKKEKYGTFIWFNLFMIQYWTFNVKLSRLNSLLITE